MLEELPYWLALWRIPGIGPGQFRQITDRFPTMQAFFDQPRSALEALGLSARQSQLVCGFQNGAADSLVAGVNRDLAWLEQDEQHHILSWAHDDYPPLLREIKGSPPLLFVRGNASLLGLPQIAIVGSRNCSRQGQRLAREFAACFAANGFIPTSGLAMGIDAAAHSGAMAAGGNTIAVLAHGLDEIYPKRNQALGEEVVAQGALVSEFPVGVTPRAQFFPRRNRIISGLSLGVLVVEAALKSGSLITAHEAVDQGREVFAIPGSIHDPLVKGCHALIRNGARLVETAQQVVDELLPLLGYVHQQLEPIAVTKVINLAHYEPRSAEHQLLAALEFEPTSMDQLVGLTGLSVADISAALVLLELDGIIEQQQGGYCRV